MSSIFIRTTYRIKKLWGCFLWGSVRTTSSPRILHHCEIYIYRYIYLFECWFQCFIHYCTSLCLLPLQAWRGPVRLYLGTEAHARKHSHWLQTAGAAIQAIQLAGLAFNTHTHTLQQHTPSAYFIWNITLHSIGLCNLKVCQYWRIKAETAVHVIASRSQMSYTPASSQRLIDGAKRKCYTTWNMSLSIN